MLYKYNPFKELLVDVALQIGPATKKVGSYNGQAMLEYRPHGWQKDVAAYVMGAPLARIGDICKVSDRFVWFTEDDLKGFDGLTDRERARGFRHDEICSDVERAMSYPSMLYNVALGDHDRYLKSADTVDGVIKYHRKKIKEAWKVVRLKHKIQKLLCLEKPFRRESRYRIHATVRQEPV